MQGEYRTKFILALLGHACLGLSSKKCELLSEANDGQNQINLIFTITSISLSYGVFTNTFI